MRNGAYLKRAAAAAALSAILAVPAVVGLTAGAADARPMREGSIKSECAAAGGRYSTHIYDGSRISTCSYTGINGGRYTDHYENGLYMGTSNDWPRR